MKGPGRRSPGEEKGPVRKRGRESGEEKGPGVVWRPVRKRGRESFGGMRKWGRESFGGKKREIASQAI
jgi:hypothetical protein